jgi:hypothetical protein
MDSVKKTPPTLIKVIAIFQIVFGVLGVLCSMSSLAALGGGFTGSFGAPPANDPQAKMMKELQDELQRLPETTPGGRVVQYSQLGLDVLLSVVMLVSGLGLLQMQAWGRSLAIGYAVLSLLNKVFTTTYTLVVTLPALNTLMDNFIAKGQPSPQMQPILTVVRLTPYFALVVAAVTAIYPLLVLFVMLKGSTRAAFRADGPVPAEPPPTAEDEGWGRG